MATILKSTTYEHLWLKNTDLQAMAAVNPQEFALASIIGPTLHPSIATAIKDAHATVVAKWTLKEVILSIIKKDGWGKDEEFVMQSATVDDFMKTILTLQGNDLKLFLFKNMDIYANRAGLGIHFGSAPINFLKACKRIQTECIGTRWPTLIENIFKELKLETDLNSI